MCWASQGGTLCCCVDCKLNTWFFGGWCVFFHGVELLKVQQSLLAKEYFFIATLFLIGYLLFPKSRELCCCHILLFVSIGTIWTIILELKDQDQIQMIFLVSFLDCCCSQCFMNGEVGDIIFSAYSILVCFYPYLKVLLSVPNFIICFKLYNMPTVNGTWLAQPWYSFTHVNA